MGMERLQCAGLEKALTMLPTIAWKNNNVVMIDQRRLPQREVYVECGTYGCVARAIEKMVIRGAPAIGVAAAYGVALGVMAWKDGRNGERGNAERGERNGEQRDADRSLADVRFDRRFDHRFERICGRLAQTRPTAVNLFWAIDRMKAVYAAQKGRPLAEIKQRMLEEARAVEAEDVKICRLIGSHGQALIRSGDSILTHCNAGALATAGYGTALGVVRAAHEAGKTITVYADETRPFLQGARLTCWELARDNIPVVLITDNMAGALMKKGGVSAVIVGADRIAANGDTANKIGTYGVAVLAAEHGIPFYVAAPMSTIDFALETGDLIPIEERAPDEVRKIGGRSLAPEGQAVWNPAFDVTPARFIAAVITERGVARPPFGASLAGLKAQGARG